MPVLVLSIAEDLNKLFQDGGMATITLLCKLCRIMVVTIYIPFMFIIGILCSKNRGTDRTSKMFDVVLPVKRSDI